MEGDFPAYLVTGVVDGNAVGEEIGEEDDGNVGWTGGVIAVDGRGRAGENITRRAPAGDAADGTCALTFLAIVDGCEARRDDRGRRSSSRWERPD